MELQDSLARERQSITLWDVLLSVSNHVITFFSSLHNLQIMLIISKASTLLLLRFLLLRYQRRLISRRCVCLDVELQPDTVCHVKDNIMIIADCVPHQSDSSLRCCSQDCEG